MPIQLLRTLSLYFSLFLMVCCKSGAQSNKDRYNLDFEQLDSAHFPLHWSHAPNNDYRIQVDSAIHLHEKYSLTIAHITKEGGFGAAGTRLLAPLTGSRLKLSGYIRTAHVDNGFAGLYLRVNDKNNQVIGFDNMHEKGIKGSSGWKEYSIVLPYDPARSAQVHIGALLAGDGEIWVDHLRLFVDDKPIDQVAVRTSILDHGDSLLLRQQAAASTALSSNFSPAKVRQLADLCKIWGFCKYYHPAVGKGLYDWDSTLMHILPDIVAGSPQKAFATEEACIDRLGKVPHYENCGCPDPANIKMWPDYGGLFEKGHISPGLMEKLAFIRDNRDTSAGYYASLTQLGFAGIQNETYYGADPYPSSAVRLLTLFRYWNIVQYFFPYRYAMKEDWNKVLEEFIPRFIHAADKREYLLASLELIGRIHDTHANVWGPVNEMDTIKGVYIPSFQSKFIGDTLVVTGYYTSSSAIDTGLTKGDIIQQIDGVPVDSLVRRYLPLTPASNYETQLRDMASSRGFLLRSNRRTSELSIIHNGMPRKITIERIPLGKANVMIDWTDASDASDASAFRLIRPDIGYINAGKLKPADLDSIRLLFKDTKGVIVDLRCYPGTFMPFTYGAWLKENSSPFVRFTRSSACMPGTFSFGSKASNGGAGNNGAFGFQYFPVYKGKLIVIVNSITQSQAEYTAMALRSAPSALVMGSTTAGADGNVTQFSLPGNIQTMFSGIGIYYPDNGETQRVGVRIDIPVHATVEGIRHGRDEYLEKALSLLQ